MYFGSCQIFYNEKHVWKTSLFANPKCGFYCTKSEVFHQWFLQYMWPNPQFAGDLVTFTGEILSLKLRFLVKCSFASKALLLFTKSETFYHPVKYLWWEFFTNLVNGFYPLSVFRKMHYRRCWIGS